MLGIADGRQHPEFKGVFRGRDCWFGRVTNAMPPPPTEINCYAYAEGANSANGDQPLTVAKVEVAKLPGGPVTMTVPAAQ